MAVVTKLTIVDTHSLGEDVIYIDDRFFLSNTEETEEYAEEALITIAKYLKASTRSLTVQLKNDDECDWWNAVDKSSLAYVLTNAEDWNVQSVVLALALEQ